jgi:hypothetical protein
MSKFAWNVSQVFVAAVCDRRDCIVTAFTMATSGKPRLPRLAPQRWVTSKEMSAKSLGGGDCASLGGDECASLGGHGPPLQVRHR